MNIEFLGTPSNSQVSIILRAEHNLALTQKKNNLRLSKVFFNSLPLQLTLNNPQQSFQQFKTPFIQSPPNPRTKSSKGTELNLKVDNDRSSKGGT